MRKRILVLLLSGALCPGARAEPFRKAEVTRTVNNVSLLEAQQAPKPAAPGDVVQGATAVKTAGASRAELTFPDQTITRLGANALFRFREGGRDMTLEGGTMLFSSPEGAGGGQVQAGAVTAAVTGTNFIVYYLLGGAVGVAVLEGKVRLFLTADSKTQQELGPGESSVVPAGATGFNPPVMVDLKNLIATSPLLQAGGFKPLPAQALIVRAANAQRFNRAEQKTTSANALVLVSSDFLPKTAPETTADPAQLSNLIALYKNNIALLINPEKDFSKSLQDIPVDPALIEKLRELALANGGDLTVENLAEAVGLLSAETPQRTPAIVAAAIALLEKVTGGNSLENRIVLAKAALINIPPGEKQAPTLAAQVIGQAVQGGNQKDLAAAVLALRGFFLADFPADEQTDAVVSLDQALVSEGILAVVLAAEEFADKARTTLNNPDSDAPTSGDPDPVNDGTAGAFGGSGGGSSNSGATPTPSPTPTPLPTPVS